MIAIPRKSSGPSAGISATNQNARAGPSSKPPSRSRVWPAPPAGCGTCSSPLSLIPAGPPRDRRRARGLVVAGPAGPDHGGNQAAGRGQAAATDAGHRRAPVPVRPVLPGPDTKAWKRFEPWMTTIVDLDTGQVLGVVDGRDHKGVGEWLFKRPLEWRLGVQVVAPGDEGPLPVQPVLYARVRRRMARSKSSDSLVSVPTEHWSSLAGCTFKRHAGDVLGTAHAGSCPVAMAVAYRRLRILTPSLGPNTASSTRNTSPSLRPGGLKSVFLRTGTSRNDQRAVRRHHRLILDLGATKRTRL